MAKPIITDKPIIDQAEFNGVTIWRKEGGSIEVSDTNYPSMKAAIWDLASKAGITLQDGWNTQYSGWYLIQQLKGRNAAGENPDAQESSASSGNKINGFEYVDLGLSVKWASCNVGASKPEEYGTYFAWGDVKGQTRNGSSWSGGGFSDYPSYELDENGNLKPAYDAAHVNLGGSWRMPTKAEMQELIDNCTPTWTSDYEGTGVVGWIFTSNKVGYTDKSIFLPAAGSGIDSGLNDAGSEGKYWSGTFYYDRSARALELYRTISDNVSTGGYDRSIGRPVRPVTE